MIIIIIVKKAKKKLNINSTRLYSYFMTGVYIDVKL